MRLHLRPPRRPACWVAWGCTRPPTGSRGPASHPTTPRRPSATGPRPSRPGAPWPGPNGSSACSATCGGSTSSSSAAGPRTDEGPRPSHPSHARGEPRDGAATAHRWVAEAARVLRPGGRLVFLVNAWLVVLCQDEVGDISDRLRRDWRTPRRIEWADDGSIEFQRPPGEWIALLRGYGFEVERLEHPLADPEADVHALWTATPDWPRRWPPEEVWLARLRG